MRDLVSVRNNRLVWGLTCGLIVSLLGNFFLTQMFMESQNLNRDLSSAYDELTQSYQELEEHQALLGSLTSTFSITQVNKGTVNIALKAYFLSDENSLRSIQLKASLMVFVNDYAVLLSMRIPAPPIGDYQLENGEFIVLVDRTFDLSRYETPGVAIAYGISPIELRFFNGSTVLLDNFTQGKCSVTPQATISMVKVFRGGIAPLWEGEYEYPPSLVIYSLDELKRKFLLRRVTGNVDQRAYTAEILDRSIDFSNSRTLMNVVMTFF